MKRGKPLKRTSELQRSELRRSPRPTGERPEDVAPGTPWRTPLQEPFRPVVSAREYRCARCRRDMADHWHHWLSQRRLRDYARSQRLDDPDTRRLLRRLLHDPRNLAPMCHGCHWGGEHTGIPDGTAAAAGVGPFRRADLPLEAISFAASLGQEWVALLCRDYPR